MTAAAFMELALYHPECGYYARAAQRSGRAGDFFTSVDVGPLFGDLISIQIAEMFALLNGPAQAAAAGAEPSFDLVEAGAGNGRLSADILRAARERDPAFYERIGLHLAEASALARAAQAATLQDVADRLRSSTASVPDAFEGVLIANELLDAMPTHQVVMREEGLKEVYVEGGDGTAGEAFGLREGEPSTPRLEQYLASAAVRLEPGWRAEINLAAIDWMRDAASRLTRGFMILVDYGHEARELYSVTHSGGTLTSFSGHRSSGAESSQPSWLLNPGEQDITAHVDFTSVRTAAVAEGLTPLGFLDQTYFLMGLVGEWNAERLAEHAAALKMLMLPGGLGSTMKVLLLGKNVGAPALRGCSFKVRVT